ncbi:UNVERIFIED_ORG: hypothetical protein J2W87_005705 [Pseudomonas putida]|nr:hypothetical protein [Pseudomonas putida]
MVCRPYSRLLTNFSCDNAQKKLELYFIPNSHMIFSEEA